MINRISRTVRSSSEKLQDPTIAAVITALLSLIVLILILLAASSWYERQLVAEKRAEAALEVSLRGNVLTSIMTRRFARLQGLYAFALAEPTLGGIKTNFEPFASALYSDSNGIRSFSIAPGGVVSEVYPVIGNESAVGYTPLDDPRADIRTDALLAIETKEIIVSGPVDLMDGGTGIIVRQAVYKDDTFWGFVNLVIDLSALISEAGVNAPGSNLDFALRDGQGQIIFGSPALFEHDPVFNSIELPEGIWELAAYPPDGWQATVRTQLLLFWIAGLLIIMLLVSLIHLSINRQARLALAVQHRTTELSQLNNQLVQSQLMLEERVQQRTGELRSLLEVSFNLASNLELQPLLNVILDQLGMVIGYDAARIQLVKEGSLVTVAHRGVTPPIFDRLSPQESNSTATNHLFNYWQTTDGNTPVRSNSNNPNRIEAEIGIDPGESAPSWIAIPLRYHNNLTGLILLSRQANKDFYTAQHEKLVMVIANQAAVTIENANLYQDGRNLAVLQERQRLARELHDSVSQALYGIALGTKTAQALLEKNPLKVAEPLDYILSLSEAALTEMRALIFELRPESLEKEGLLAAIEKQAQVLQSRFGLNVRRDCSEEPALPLHLKETLYRVLQESIHNITKHAAAKNVEIKLHQDANGFVLEIKDDGQGFNPQESFPGHLGLRSMQERVEQVGGSLLIDSQPGKGTCLQAIIPVG